MAAQIFFFSPFVSQSFDSNQGNTKLKSSFIGCASCTEIYISWTAEILYARQSETHFPNLSV